MPPRLCSEASKHQLPTWAFVCCFRNTLLLPLRGSSRPNKASSTGPAPAWPDHRGWRSTRRPRQLDKRQPPATTPRAAHGRGKAGDPASSSPSCCRDSGSASALRSPHQEPAAAFQPFTSPPVSDTLSCTHTCLLQHDHLEVTTKQGVCLLWWRITNWKKMHTVFLKMTHEPPTRSSGSFCQ